MVSMRIQILKVGACWDVYVNAPGYPSDNVYRFANLHEVDIYLRGIELHTPVHRWHVDTSIEVLERLPVLR